MVILGAGDTLTRRFISSIASLCSLEEEHAQQLNTLLKNLSKAHAASSEIPKTKVIILVFCILIVRTHHKLLCDNPLSQLTRLKQTQVQHGS